METNKAFEQSDTWTEEDCLDVTTFSWQYAATIFDSDPDILGGTRVFIGTRVPIKTLLDYLEAGDSIDEFLDHFPSVSREQVISVLESRNYDRLNASIQPRLRILAIKAVACGAGRHRPPEIRNYK